MMKSREETLSALAAALLRERCGVVLARLKGLDALEESDGFDRAREAMDQMAVALGRDDLLLGLLAPGEVLALLPEVGSLSDVESVGRDLVRVASLAALDPGVGVALSLPGETAHGMIARTRRAADRSWSESSGAYVVSTEKPSAYTTEKQAVSELKRGLERREVVAHYQPVAVLPGGTTWGFEALVRWNHPERGTLTPPYFLPLVKDSELASSITRRVLEDSSLVLERWQHQHPGVRLSVNLSNRDWADPTTARAVRDALTRSGADPSGMVVEVPMSVLVNDPDRSRRAVDDLKAIGVSVAVDDFGTGATSLADLRLLPVDGLKVDRSFVEEAASRDARAARRGKSVMRAALALADGLDLYVVAEGVETPEQERVASDLGCTLAQGYHYARALPRDEAERYLGRH